MTNNRPIKKLGDIVDILDNQRKPISSEEREKRNQGKKIEELYPYYGATRQNGWIDNFIFDEELVLLGEDGADFYDINKEKAYIINGKSWVNNHAHVLKGKKGILNNRYLCFYLNIIDYHGYVSGATRLKLNQGSMKNIQIPLPPLPTQKAIVAKLDEAFSEIDDAIATTQANIEKTNEFTKSVLYKVFEEVDWEKVSLGDLIKQKDLGLVKGQTDQGLNKKYKYLKMNNISLGGNLNLNKLINVDLDENEVIRFKLNYGDFLFNTRNSFELVGKSCVFDVQSDDIYLYNNNILRLRFKESVYPFFINYSFLTNSQKKQLEIMKSGTTNVSAIYYKSLKDLEIPLPPLAKQKEIVKYLDEVFAHTKEIKSEYEAKLEQLKELKASILQSAFEGKLI